MNSNKTWTGLVAVMALITLWFTWGATEKLYEYARFQKRTDVEISNWSVEKVAQDRYALKAQYSYLVEGKEYHGETLFDGALYRNPWAAQEAIPIENVKAWKAWYAAGNFEISSL